MRRKVKKVLDGDTFETYRKVNGTNKVRLANYNAPEKHQFGGQRATNRLRRFISGQTVTVTPRGRSYDRVVADVRIKRRKVTNLMRGK